MRLQDRKCMAKVKKADRTKTLHFGNFEGFINVYYAICMGLGKFSMVKHMIKQLLEWVHPPDLFIT